MKVLRKIVAVLFVLFTLTLPACSSTDKKMENVSELRNEFMAGGDETLTLEVISGQRESAFKIDGTSTPKCEFTVITVTCDEFDADSVVNYAFTLGENRYDGALNKHPLKNSYSTELPFCVSGQLEVKITQGEKEKTVTATSVKKENTISAERALETAQIRLADKFDECTTNGKLNGEIFVRYIKNPISTAQGYYWYVALCPDAHTVYAVLIDEVSGEVVAVRE